MSSVRSKCQSWDEPGWNCLLRAQTPKHQVWLEITPSCWRHFQPSPSSISTRSRPAPCLAPRKGCKADGIPNSTQTPGTDSTPHIQACPFPGKGLCLHHSLWNTVTAVGAGSSSSLSSGSRQDLPAEGGKKGKYPPKIPAGTAGDQQDDQQVSGRARRAAQPRRVPHTQTPSNPDIPSFVSSHVQILLESSGKIGQAARGMVLREQPTAQAPPGKQQGGRQSSAGRTLLGLELLPDTRTRDKGQDSPRGSTR